MEKNCKKEQLNLQKIPSLMVLANYHSVPVLGINLIRKKIKIRIKEKQSQDTSFNKIFWLYHKNLINHIKNIFFKQLISSYSYLPKCGIW